MATDVGVVVLIVEVVVVVVAIIEFVSVAVATEGAMVVERIVWEATLLENGMCPTANAAHPCLAALPHAPTTST